MSTFLLNYCNDDVLKSYEERFDSLDEALSRAKKLAENPANTAFALFKVENLAGILYKNIYTIWRKQK